METQNIGGLEQQIQMGRIIDYFIRKPKNTSNEPEDLSRRKFIKNAAIVTGGTILGTGIIGETEEALAWKIKNLPPGFWRENCKDFRLIDCFHDMYKRTRQYRPDQIKDMLTRSIGIKGQQIDRKTPFTEPAYWFTISYYNGVYRNNRIFIDFRRDIGHIVEKVKNENPKMDLWSKGLGAYFQTWVKKRINDANKAEIFFAKSFIMSCGRPKSEYNALLKRIDNQQNDNYITGLMSSLKEQPYEDKLLAAWSIYYLTINLARETNSENQKYKFTRYNIEEPLWQKNITPKIRGPPHYNI